MTVHTVTEQVTLRSKVIVNAPPGERPEQVIVLALQEVYSVREDHNLHNTAPTEIAVDLPMYQDNRRWFVYIKMVFCTTVIGEPIGDRR